MREPTNYECDCIIAECMEGAFIGVVHERHIGAVICEHHGEQWSDTRIRAMTLQVRSRWFRFSRRAVVREAFRYAHGLRK
jgi:hypothetical protein